MNLKVTSAVAALLVTVLPSAILNAENPGTFVYAVRGVTVNGTAMASSGTLFDDDFVETGNGAVNLQRPGSTVMVPPKSAFTMKGNTLALGCGEALVKTLSGLSVSVAGYKISPVGQSARYQVFESDAATRIVNLEGQISVAQASHNLVLEEGRTITFPGHCATLAGLKDASFALDAAQNQGSQAGAGQAGAGSTGAAGQGGAAGTGGGSATGAGAGGAASGGGIFGSTAVIVTGMSAAVATGIGVTVGHNSSLSASPSAP